MGRRRKYFNLTRPSFWLIFSIIIFSCSASEGEMSEKEVSENDDEEEEKCPMYMLQFIVSCNRSFSFSGNFKQNGILTV